MECNISKTEGNTGQYRISREKDEAKLKGGANGVIEGGAGNTQTKDRVKKTFGNTSKDIMTTEQILIAKGIDLLEAAARPHFDTGRKEHSLDSQNEFQSRNKQSEDKVQNEIQSGTMQSVDKVQDEFQNFHNQNETEELAILKSRMTKGGI